MGIRLTALPKCRVFDSGGWTIPNTTWTALTWNSESYDLGDLHSTSANQSRITITDAGYYLISAGVQWAASSAGTYRYLLLEKNGNTDLAFDSKPPGTAGIALTQAISDVQYLAAGDYFELYVKHDKGADLTVTAGSANTWLAVTKII